MFSIGFLRVQIEEFEEGLSKRKGQGGNRAIPNEMRTLKKTLEEASNKTIGKKRPGEHGKGDEERGGDAMQMAEGHKCGVGRKHLKVYPHKSNVLQKVCLSLPGLDWGCRAPFGTFL